MSTTETTMTPLRDRAAWQALKRHHAELEPVHLRDLFADDPDRGERLTAEAAGLYLDYSKNRITDETVALLLKLAEESGLRERIEAMFRGERINVYREPLGAARGAADAQGRIAGRRRRRRRRRGARGARSDVGVRRPRPLGRMEGPHRASRSATSSTSGSAARTSDR